MRITIVLGPFLPVPPVLGGAVEKAHLLLAGFYRDAGHAVTIVSRQFADFPNEEIVDRIKYLRIVSSGRTRWLLLNLGLDFLYALRVASRLPPSDITITNSFFLPLLLRRRTAGKIYVHVARFPKRQMWLYSRADRLQAISHAVAKEIVRQEPTLSGKVVTIGYPAPDDYFCATPGLPRKKIVLYVGRIAREKGIHLLIGAFAALSKQTNPSNVSEWTLRIVGPHEISQGGDGAEYLGELMQLAAPLGPACSFAGPVFNTAELLKEYQAASIFVYPSLAESGEAFGLAPLEGMAAGCAVIVSSLPCFDDFVQDGLTAVKFDHKSAAPQAALADKLAALIRDQKSRDEIAKSGVLAADEFRTSKIGGMMLKDFAMLAGGQ